MKDKERGYSSTNQNRRYKFGTSHIALEYWAGDENSPPTRIDNNLVPLRPERRATAVGGSKKGEREDGLPLSPNDLCPALDNLYAYQCQSTTAAPGRRKTCKLRERGQTTPFLHSSQPWREMRIGVRRRRRRRGK